MPRESIVVLFTEKRPRANILTGGRVMRIFNIGAIIEFIGKRTRQGQYEKD